MRTSPRRADFSDTQPLPLAADELRRQALLRSQQRGRRVARRRLAWRWSLWFAGRALRLSLLPLAVLALALAGTWWWLNHEVATPPLPPAVAASGVPAPPDAASTPVTMPPESASAAASEPADAVPAAGPLPLRLDDSEAVLPAPAHAQSEAPPPDNDRRSRERP